ncbi:MAG: hypothetical protein HUU01_00760 [Saprospiraceae bacterium]|nr:hypothetical protein [Saprospiraceae bacterium]
MIKVASAWFLLSLSLAQWVGGHLCIEVRYFVEIQRQMSAAEKALAQVVEQETGIESAVRVLDETEITPRGNFYGDFVFTQASEKETVFYVVEDQSDLTTLKSVSEPQDDHPASNSDKANLLKGLFKEFMIPESALPSAPADRQADSVFHFAAPGSYAFCPPLIHPPAQA